MNKLISTTQHSPGKRITQVNPEKTATEYERVEMGVFSKMANNQEGSLTKDNSKMHQNNTTLYFTTRIELKLCVSC